MVVWRAALLENGSLGNIEKLAIHVADVVRMIGVSTLQEVGNESWSKYRDTVDKSDERDDRETNQQDSTGRGKTRRRDRETHDRGTRAAGRE